MKYDDEELAEAALLLAHLEPKAMPKSLEGRIVAQSRTVASEVRFSTTKSAAVEVEAPNVIPLHAPRSTVRTWGGWIAAAACFALTVYEWRLHTIERLPATQASSTPATASLSLNSEGGRAVASVRWEPSTRSAEVVIADLPANASNEQYRLWLSSSDETNAVPVGTVTCEQACSSRVLALAGAAPVDPIRGAWLTHEVVGDAASTLVRARIVAEGHR